MIETKEMILGFTDAKVLRSIYEHQLEYVECLTAFGWQKVEKVTHDGKDFQVITRDTDMSNYEQLKALEEKYNAARYSVDVYEEPNAFIVFLLFLLFVFPGVLYLVKKSKDKKEIALNNQRQEEIMKQCVSEGKKLL